MKYLLSLLLFLTLPLVAADELIMRDNLKVATKGDYLVTAQGKMATVLHIYERGTNTLSMEEVSIPIPQIPCSFTGWKDWIEKGAPGHTGWVLYTIEISSGHMLQCYSVTSRAWINLPQADNFLSTLLNLHLNRVPDWQKKKAGPPPLVGVPDRRLPWQPKMIVDGKEIKGVLFDVWRTRWPKDSTILSEKTIEVYLPQDSVQYPTYFPYWLQISGVIGKAQVHILDSGHQMNSPVQMPRSSSS